MVFTGSQGRSIQVAIEGDASSLRSALDGAQSGLMNLRNAVKVAGGVLAAFSAGALAKATSAAADFEEQMVEVQKVTDETTAAQLSEDVRELAETLPIAQSELAAITADAARFGVRGTENINRFTETVARMAVATDLSASEAGEAFARLATLTNTPIEEMENLGSAINTLSNNFATSSQEIVDAMLRGSGALSQLGLQQTEIIALSAAMNEVSESSERAGTRLRRLGQELLEPRKQEALAEALGMSVEGFREMAKESPVDLIRLLAETMAEGGDAASKLRGELSTTSRTAVSGLAQNLDGLNEALGESTESFEDATSLQDEFEAASDTTNARIQIMRNRLRNLAITTGGSLLPTLNDLIETVNDAISAFNDLNRSTDGLAGQLLGLSGVALGVGLAFGGLAGVIAGAGAAAFLAWSKNMAGIRDSTTRMVEDVGQSLSRLSRTTREQTGDQIGFWGMLGIHIADVIDFITTEISVLVDRAVAGFEIIGTAIGSVVEQTQALARGDLAGAREVASQARSDIDEISSDLERRTTNRRSAQSLRTSRRQAALEQDDRSLLPRSGRGGEEGPGDTPGVNAEDVVNEFRREQGRTREELAGYLEDIRDENRRTADATTSTLGGGPCDLRDHLLTPLERAPRPVETAEAGVGAGAGGYTPRTGGDTRQPGSTGARFESGPTGSGSGGVDETGGGGSTGSVFSSGGGHGAGDITVRNTLEVDGKELTKEQQRASKKYFAGVTVTE